MADRWGVVATVREDAKTMQAFLAHHKCMGASEIHLFFDDPDDPFIAEASRIPGVFVTVCDAAHWAGRRPRAHQARQKINANRAYPAAGTDWLIHIDGDELIHADRDPGEFLANVPAEVSVVRLRPAEEMVPPRDNGLSVFRFALPRTRRGNRIGEAVYGEVYPILDRGLLSHSAGKFFVRTGVDDVSLSIHGPRIGGRRDEGQTSRDIVLLHRHGGDEEMWMASFKRRLASGAYRKALHDDRSRGGRVNGMGRNAYLSDLYEREGEDGIRRFFRQVCQFGRDKQPLRRAGALLKLRLWVPEKVSTWFPDAPRTAARNVRLSAQGGLEADTEFRGANMTVALQGNHTEVQLARGQEAEEAELDAFEALVAGRKVAFWDIGANAGIYSILCARAAAKGSKVQAFEPNPVMALRCRRNLDLNGIQDVELHEIALGSADTTAKLGLHANLGQASMLRGDASDAIDVKVQPLAAFVPAPRKGVRTILKIDVEGAEPSVLQPFFKAAPTDRWPMYVLYEHAHTDQWSAPPEDVFPDAYEVQERFADNTLLVLGGKGRRT